jgi:hypothetical protein
MEDNNEKNGEVTSETHKQQEQPSVEALPIEISKTDDSPEHKRETTGSQIARIYVYAFFATIGVTFLIGLWHNFEGKDYRDMLITVSGILSGPLGFIIGYYFKSATSKD